MITKFACYMDCKKNTDARLPVDNQTDKIIMLNTII